MSWPSAEWLKALDLRSHQLAAVCMGCSTLVGLAYFKVAFFGEMAIWVILLLTTAGIFSFFLWLSNIYVALSDHLRSNLSKKSLKFVLNNCWWHMGSSDDRPAMQIVSDWYVTNPSKSDSAVLKVFMKRGLILQAYRRRSV